MARFGRTLARDCRHQALHAATVLLLILGGVGPVAADVVYMRSTVGPPWGLSGNETALDTVFGAGQWQDLRYETANAATVFSGSTCFVFMEGGDSNADELEAFLGANQTLIENWVTAGGRLLVNAAPNEGDGMALGFGGVQLVYLDPDSNAVAVNPAHPIFVGPYGPVAANLTGSYFNHASVSGPGISPILRNAGNLNANLAELAYGGGHVVFGGLTLPFFTSHPAWTQPDCTYLHANLLDYAAGPCLTTCGNGTIELGEQCDDGNVANGDCCSATCQYESAGSSCADATVCNGAETCDGAGVCVAGMALNCDDNNACTADSCDPEDGCVNDDALSSGCLTADKSILLIKHPGDDSKDKLVWKWSKGAAVTAPALADPTGGTDYALCVYAGNALVADAVLPGGLGWSALGTKGYKFKGTSPNGLSLALLKGGAAGKSKALAKGKGAALPDPTLPLAYPVTVQLKKDGSPLCLQSTFTATGEKKNDTTQFKNKQ